VTVRAVPFAAGVIPRIAATPSGFVSCWFLPLFFSVVSDPLQSVTLTFCLWRGCGGDFPRFSRNSFVSSGRDFAPV